MPLHSVSEAARLAGVTRRTIYRHIGMGKLSAAQSGNKNTRIETTELLRVYGDITQPARETMSLHPQLSEEIRFLVSAVTEIHQQLFKINNKLNSLSHLHSSPPVSRKEGHKVLEWVKARRKQSTIKKDSLTPAADHHNHDDQ